MYYVYRQQRFLEDGGKKMNTFFSHIISLGRQYAMPVQTGFFSVSLVVIIVVVVVVSVRFHIDADSSDWFSLVTREKYPKSQLILLYHLIAVSGVVHFIRTHTQTRRLWMCLCAFQQIFAERLQITTSSQFIINDFFVVIVIGLLLLLLLLLLRCVCLYVSLSLVPFCSCSCTCFCLERTAVNRHL